MADLQAFDRQRVLRAAVDVALVGVDGEGRDGHALQHAEGVALEHAAIHERAGVALVGVADDVLLVTGGLGHGGPLETGRETGAAATAKAALRDLVADLRRTHLGEDAAQGLEATLRDVVFQGLGVDLPEVLRGHADLLLEEGSLRLTPGVRLDLAQRGQRASRPHPG